MSCGIYKITNKLNQKFYIGKSINIENRWKQHKKANDLSPIHCAMRKYGIENFELSILEYCDVNKLNEREIYWIQFFNAYENDNYNATRGGDGAAHPVKISHEELLKIIEQLKDTTLSISKIAEQHNTSEKTISDINVGKSRKLLDLEYPIRKNKFDNKERKKEISKDELMKLLEETKGDFEKIAVIYNVTSMTIRNRCKDYNLSTQRKDYGFIDDQSYHSIKIWQCDPITKEKIKIFNSIREASRYMNCNQEAIRRALNSTTHISKGFYWIKD